MAVPSLTEMFRRFVRPQGRTKPAWAVEICGWQYLLFGGIMFFGSGLAASLLHLPSFVDQGQHYFRLAGMLVSGLGILYVVSGRLGSLEFAFASLLDRPLVPVVMFVLWRRHILPGPLALAFSISDFGGFLFTLIAWRLEQQKAGSDDGPKALTSLPARAVGGTFGLLSGVVRNARTFHPDGRTFLGTVRSLSPNDPDLATAADRLSGSVLMRIGMGLLKRGMPAWLATLVPDAPSIAMRFFVAGPAGDLPLRRRPDEDLDLLCTAGGDRLWKLLLNLAAGGFWCGLNRFDYFRNRYYAEVPHRVRDTGLDAWIRLVPQPSPEVDAAGRAGRGGPAREAGLTAAVRSRAAVRIEAQRAGRGRAEPFVPFAEITFDEEVAVDQEALRFDPGEGRGFLAHGFLTNLRLTVYPASAARRPDSTGERALRERAGLLNRIAKFFG
jgi:hypothetical protein